LLTNLPFSGLFLLYPPSLQNAVPLFFLLNPDFFTLLPDGVLCFSMVPLGFDVYHRIEDADAVGSLDSYH